MKPKKEREPRFEIIFTSYNHADVAFVKSLLQAHDIAFYVNNENVNLVGNLTFAEPMRVMVSEKDAILARELLEEFKGRYLKFG